MRLAVVNCVLLACVATAIAANNTSPVRPKRDLQFWKNLIASKLGLKPIVPVAQNEPNVKLLRIPGFENVIVKAVPKVTVVEAPAPVPERIVQVNPSMAILEGYLGTKTPDQTLMALEGMKQLLQSGILNARQDVIELMPPRPPPVFVYPQVVRDQLVYPEPRPVAVPMPMPMQIPMPMPMPVVPKYPMYPMPAPFPAPLPALRPLPMPLPPVQVVPRPVLPPPVLPPPMPIVPEIIVPEIKPVPIPPPVAIPMVPTRYSYQQRKNDGSVMSFYSEGSAEVVVMETNKPPPPPPSYIIDRFQKIIYGLPLGVPVPIKPALSPAFVIPKPINIPVGRVPVVMIPEAPIITAPSDVSVKVNDKMSHKGRIGIVAGSKVVKMPFTSTLVREDIVVPKPLAIDIPGTPLVDPPLPPVLAEKDESGKKGHKFTYQQVNAEGTIIYPGTEGMKETIEIIEDISKIAPPPPPFLVESIEDFSEKSKKPKSVLGYSFKIANGVGSYKNTNNDKIFYSRLEPGSPKPGLTVFPEPLSSPDNEEHKPNNNVYLVGNNKDDSDNANENPIGSEKDEYGNPFISTKIEDNKATGASDVPEVDNGKETTVSDIQPIKMIPALPMPIAGENEGPRPSAIGGAKFSYTLMKNDGAPVKFEGNADFSNNHYETAFQVPEIVAVPDGKLVATTAGHSKQPCKHKGNTCIPKKRPVLVQESIEIPVKPPAVVDVIRPLSQPAPIEIKVDQKLPASVMFAQPVFSRYIYKQLSHSNPRPFTVVPVEDRPRIAVPKGEVKVKVSPHEHFRPDGSRYLCTELHVAPGVPIAPIPPIPIAQAVATVPDDLVYVPPLVADVPPPTSHLEVKAPSFSYTLVNSQQTTTTTEEAVEPETTEKPISLNENPIVVAEDPKYSYVQNNSDGSSMSVQGNNGNTVSVTVEEATEKSDINRGDIPDALA